MYVITHIHIYNSEGAYMYIHVHVRGITFCGKCLQCNTRVSAAVVPSIKQPCGLVSNQLSVLVLALLVYNYIAKRNTNCARACGRDVCQSVIVSL